MLEKKEVFKKEKESISCDKKKIWLEREVNLTMKIEQQQRNLSQPNKDSLAVLIGLWGHQTIVSTPSC